MLVIFEGIDGVGKSTQAALLHNRLKANGIPTILTGPFETTYGKAVRELFISSTLSRRVELTLIASAIGNVIDEVADDLNRSVVIFDRFIYSTYAYHGAGFGVGSSLIERIFDATLEQVEPSVVFLLDADPGLAYGRTGKAKDRIEQLPSGFHATVRNSYLEIAHQDSRINVLDATESVDAIHLKVANVIENLWSRREFCD